MDTPVCRKTKLSEVEMHVVFKGGGNSQKKLLLIVRFLFIHPCEMTSVCLFYKTKFVPLHKHCCRSH